MTRISAHRKTQLFFWKETLELVLEAMAGDPEFAARLRWGLAYGAPREHWFQSELAYRLQGALSRAHETCRVVCEHQKIDIVLIEKPKAFPLWKNKPSVAIELKWFGNWSVSKRQIEDFHADIAKARTYSCPALSIAAFHAVDPKTLPLSREFDWMKAQFTSRAANGNGIAEVEDLQRHFAMVAPVALTHTRSFPLTKPQVSSVRMLLAASFALP